MAKEKFLTGVGYITLTGVARKIGCRIRTTHTGRLGFCGTNMSSIGLAAMRKELKEVFHKQLLSDYPTDKYTLTVTARMSFTECETLLNETQSEK